MTDGDCPLARLCAEAERLIVRRNAAEEAALRLDGAREAAEKRAAERVFEEATLSLDHIAARASDHRPRSRTGALFSIALASADAELLSFPDLEHREDHAARLRRRLYGLRAYLEDGVRTPDGVSGFYMRADRDPLEALRG